MILGMLIGAFLYAAGLATAVFYFRRQRKPATETHDGYDKYRDPRTGLYSRKMVKQTKGG